MFSAEFALTGKNLLTGEVTVTLNRGTLILPSGKFDGLTLKARDYSNLLVDVAAQDPVLTVKEINIAAGKDLTVNRPEYWSFTPKGMITLLTAPKVELNGTGTLKGYPEDDVVAKIFLDDAKTALNFIAGVQRDRKSVV